MIRKTIALVLCIAIFATLLVGCGKNNAETSSSTPGMVGNVVGLGGNLSSKLVLKSPSNEIYYGNTVSVSWSGLREGETLTLIIEKKDGNSYKKVLEKTGLTGTSFESGDKLENECVYRFTIKAVASDGTERAADNNGFECTVLNTTVKGDVNAGMNFTFNGSISEVVLNNYLSRAMTYTYAGGEIAKDSKRVILNTGVKYVARAVVAWFPSPANEAFLPGIKTWMDDIHKTDPDIIFEACIFETCGPEISNFEIPEHVFKAFGQTPEKRSFNYKKMLYPDGFGNAQWNATHGVPDITQLETQMFFYYRACNYIDMGIEALHLGQTGLMGRNDPERKSWTKVIHLIREYAKTHARRKYVLINSHYAGHNFVGTDGVMLADFTMFPLRLKPITGKPQTCELNFSLDAPYKKGIKGTSPSGWTTSKYPYLVEFDNYGTPSASSPLNIWGYDEISWFANQPDAYRRQFLTDVRKMVAELNENGHVAMPGRRSTAGLSVSWYIVNNSKYVKEGFSDEEAVIAAFKAYK